MITHHQFLYRRPSRRHPLLLRALANPAIVTATPDVVDMRPLFLPVRNQGNVGACSGFSTAGLREGLRASAVGLANTNYFAPAFLYCRTRRTEGTFPRDVGATVADELTELHNEGVCLENQMPYLADATQDASPEMIEQATAFRVGMPQYIETVHGAAEYETALAAGQPVVFGTEVYESFERIGADGMMPVPNYNTEKVLGGHAMLGVGYNRPNQLALIRNSWGDAWGLAGYFWMPYELLPDWFEAWTAPIAA